MTVHFGSNGKPLANLVMSIASYTQAKSIVEYSESPLYNYQYSSIGKLFARLLEAVDNDPKQFSAQVRDFIRPYIPCEPTIRTQLDCFPVYKPLSCTHPERSAVYKPNVKVEGQKPVEIGYNISSLNQGFPEKWSIPHSMERVSTSKTSLQVGIEQIQAFIKTLPADDSLMVNTSDSSYGNAQFLCTLHQEQNLVNITRFKNRNVYEHSPKKGTGGANRIYGQAYNLAKIGSISRRKNPKTKELAIPKPSIETKQADETSSYLSRTNKGRSIKVVLKMYRNMMIRSKNKFSMKDKPFDLVIVEHLDADTLEPIHNKPIYLAVSGQRKGLVSLDDAYRTHYSHRWDIEPNNRFIKHQLLLDKFQSPIQAHFELWLSVIQLVEWLLFIASKEVENTPKKWQQYDPKNKTDDQSILTITQTRKSCAPFFLTFEKSAFLPKISKKGKGRKKGTKLTPKATHKPVRKQKSTKKPVEECQKNE